MRRFAAFLLALVMALSLAACGKSGGDDTGIIGKWQLSGADNNGKPITLEELAALEGSDEVDVVFEFHEDGSMSGYDREFGNTVDLTGTWEEKDGGYSMDMLGRSFDIELKDGKLVINALMNGVVLYFTKQ